MVEEDLKFVEKKATKTMFNFLLKIIDKAYQTKAKKTSKLKNIF